MNYNINNNNNNDDSQLNLNFFVINHDLSTYVTIYMITQ